MLCRYIEIFGNTFYRLTSLRPETTLAFAFAFAEKKLNFPFSLPLLHLPSVMNRRKPQSRIGTICVKILVSDALLTLTVINCLSTYYRVHVPAKLNNW